VTTASKSILSALVVTCVAGGAGGCGGGGPAWPKSAGTVASADWSEDGGESIAPHTARAAAIERSAEPTPEAKPVEAEAAKPAVLDAATPPPAIDPEVPIDLPDEVLGEEIIIEIED
jgi:hypothetical protein